MRRTADGELDLFPVTPKEEIDMCLNCTRKVCYGKCKVSCKPDGGRPRRSIQCVETGVVYQSQKDAAKAIGRSRAAMSRCISGEVETCGNFHFRIYEEV